MKRGDLVTVTVSAGGDCGKPRSAVVVQSDRLTEGGLASVVVCLVTSHLENAPAFRLEIEPTKADGLQKRSQIMVEKLLTVPAAKIGKSIGHLDDETLVRLNRTLAFIVGLAE